MNMTLTNLQAAVFLFTRVQWNENCHHIRKEATVIVPVPKDINKFLFSDLSNSYIKIIFWSLSEFTRSLGAINAELLSVHL